MHTQIHIRLEKRRRVMHTPAIDSSNDQSVDMYKHKTHTPTPRTRQFARNFRLAVQKHRCTESHRCIHGAESAKENPSKQNTRNFFRRYIYSREQFLNKDDTIEPLCATMRDSRTLQTKRCVSFVDPLFQLYWNFSSKSFGRNPRKRTHRQMQQKHPSFLSGMAFKPKRGSQYGWNN